MKIKRCWIHNTWFLPASLRGKEKMQMDAGSKHQGFLPRAIGGKEKLWLDAGYNCEVFYPNPSEAKKRFGWAAGSKTRRRFLL